MVTGTLETVMQTARAVMASLALSYEVESGTPQNLDEVYCISVNDAFVMNAWARDLGIKNIKMIPDGCGTFTRSMGMLVNKPKQGFGMRSWRYSAVINDGVVEIFNEEPGINDFSNDGDPYEVSDPETMLRSLDK